MELHGARSTGSFADFWSSRPVRPQQHGKIAGVAAGVGRRYDVDPVLVRVVLVVLAFYGGSGIALYLLGWLLLPKEGSAESPRSPSTAVLVLLGALLVVVLLGTLRSPGWLGIVVGIGAVFLLHRYRGGAVPPNGSAEPSMGTAGGGESSPHEAESSSGSTVSSIDSTVSSAAASSTVAEGDEPPARRWITLATLAAAALAALAAGLAGAPVPAAVAIALAVSGAGLVLGSFLRGGRALLLFAVPLGLVALVLGTRATPALLPGMEHDGGAGISERPTAVDQLRPGYWSDAGDLDLDLSGLPAGAPARTNVDTNTGRVHVIVPRDADVLANCSSTSGDVECLDDNGGRTGSANRSERVVDTGPDGPGGGSVQLDVRSRSGDVEVTRD